MALSGKVIGYVEISKTDDFFHDFLRLNPHKLVEATPGRVHDYELHEGERGAPGSVFSWQYTHEGKKKTAKKIIEYVNEENHMIVYKIVGGELVDELYKSFKVTFHVEPKGDRRVATWTFDFERPDTRVPYPTSLMDYICNITKDLDAHNNTTNTK